MLVFQEEEVSAELLNFHEVVNHMQEAEEEVIDNHRALLEVRYLNTENNRYLTSNTHSLTNRYSNFK